MYQPRIFVSHRSGQPDIGYASVIVQCLEAKGASVWVDVNSLKGGLIDISIEDALESCDWFVLILTPRAPEAGAFVREEVTAALRLAREGRMHMVFVECEKTPRVPPFWSQVRRIDATSDVSSACHALISLIWERVVPDALPSGRAFSAAVTLPNGNVVLAGGLGGATGSARYLGDTITFDVLAGTWQATEPLQVMRAHAVGALISRASVLVMGGGVGANLAPFSEIFDPNLQAYQAFLHQLARRYAHACACLTTGDIVVAGGNSGGGLLTLVEVITAEGRAIVTPPQLRLPVSNHAMVALDGSRVLLIGGDRGQGAEEWTEVYDINSGSMINGPQMCVARQDHAAAMLSDGRRILIAGGRNKAGVLDSIEIMDLQSGSSRLVSTMRHSRYGLSASLIDSDLVLLAGGLSPDGTALATIEILDGVHEALTDRYTAPVSAKGPTVE